MVDQRILERQWQARVGKIMRQEEAHTAGMPGVKKLQDKPLFDIYEYQPDVESEEKLIIYGQEPMIALQTSLLGAIATLLKNRDIGQWVGDPLALHLIGKPTPLSLKCSWSVNERPPFPVKGVPRPVYEIPYLIRSKANWETIKAAMGGVNGYQYGRFYATATLKDPGSDKLRNRAVYGNSEKEAIERLEALLSLSECEILSLRGHEEKNFGSRASGQKLHKNSVRVYPQYASIHAKYELPEINAIKGNPGNPTLTGTHKRKAYRIPIWLTKQPNDVKDAIVDILKFGPR